MAARARGDGAGVATLWETLGAAVHNDLWLQPMRAHACSNVRVPLGSNYADMFLLIVWISWCYFAGVEICQHVPFGSVKDLTVFCWRATGVWGLCNVSSVRVVTVAYNFGALYDLDRMWSARHTTIVSVCGWQRRDVVQWILTGKRRLWHSPSPMCWW